MRGGGDRAIQLSTSVGIYTIRIEFRAFSLTESKAFGFSQTNRAN